MKGKGKGKAEKGIEPSTGRPPSPPSLEFCLSERSFYDETEVKEPAPGTFSSLEELFGEETVKKARRKMLDITPFDMAAMVVVSLPLVMVVGCRHNSFISLFLSFFLFNCFYGCSLTFSVFTSSSTAWESNLGSASYRL